VLIGDDDHFLHTDQVISAMGGPRTASPTLARRKELDKKRVGATGSAPTAAARAPPRPHERDSGAAARERPSQPRHEPFFEAGSHGHERAPRGRQSVVTDHRRLSVTFGMSHGRGFPMAPSQAWPTTIEEMAQDVILALLRGNEELCLRLAEDARRRDSLFDMFAFVANAHGKQEKRATKSKLVSNLETLVEEESAEPFTSCDTSPALDFFFIVCAPTSSRSLSDFQTRVGER
jgi:hypothetical protein